MADSNEFKSLAQFVSVEEKTWGPVTKVIIKYTSPNYQDSTKQFSVGMNVDDASGDLLDRITGLSIGDKFCLTTKKDPENPKFNLLVDVTDAKDAPTKSASTWKGKSGGFVKDETGIAVGAAWANAFDWYKVSDIKPISIEQVAEVAQKILDSKLAMGALLRAKKASTLDKAVEKKEEKPLSVLEKARLKKQQEAVAPKVETKPEDTEKKEDLEDDDVPW